MKSTDKAGASFQNLVTLMDTLREKCPWDKKQTIKSLQKYTIEEMYELMDAINDNNVSEIKEELGDILFHTIFYSKIASEKNQFTITEVIDSVKEKLIHRHPHVFQQEKNISVEEVKKNWESIKLQEGKTSILQGVPKSLPAVIKAFRIQEKTAQVGFDWADKKNVWAKVEEELAEFKEEEQRNNKLAMEQEFGDLLFAFINYARHSNIDPEAALEKTNQKFIQRFQFIEQQAAEQKRNINELSLEEMETIWIQAKEQEI